jgi:flagellar L-ring protein precursor FlgH
MSVQKLIIVGLGLAMLSGCAEMQKLQSQPRDPAYAPVAPADLRPPVQNTGAIYQPGYDMRLFEDNKAARVGDILTIKLKEVTQAKKADDLNTAKNISASVSAPSIMGFALSALTGNDAKTELASKRTFNGQGKADQSNSLEGNISVTVTEVLPNGNLKVRGEKQVTLNQGDEYVRLSGIVRPVDIATDNTISSDKVADATLMYIGEGAMADASKMGWLSRAVLSPWFPF